MHLLVRETFVIMGCGASDTTGAYGSDPDPDEKKSNRKIEVKLRSEQARDTSLKKLLLLGPGSSGKSTLFKQCSSIYGKGFSELERRAYTYVVFHNVINSIQLLCKNSTRYSPKSCVSPALEESKKFMEQEFRDDQPLTYELVQHIKALWNDSGIRYTFDRGYDFHLFDQAKYFLDKVDELCTVGYMPTDDDILRVRAPTTAIVETQFEIRDAQFTIIDVGGQRNERRKWIHCFENVTAVLYVAAISEYNQKLYEDESTNRLVESITLFDQICNSKWFRRTHLILFLNKRDIFAEKLPQLPLHEYFPEYTGDNIYEKALDWIEQQFVTKNREESRHIYSHVTCATDRSNIKAVFIAVRDIIVRKNLKDVGLM